MSDDARFGVGLSRLADAPSAAVEACASALAGLGGAPATLAVVFASPSLADDGERLLAAVTEHLAPQHLIGCTGDAVRGLGPVIMLADPFTFPADGLLAQLNAEAARPLVVGGLASGGRRPGEHRLFAGADVLTEGAVGLALRGVRLYTVVSQGCMPIGPEMVITDAEGSVVHELAGSPAMMKLEEVIDGLPPDERRLASQGLMAGLVIDENRPEYQRGDFLVRGIHGGDRETGALVVGEHVRIGQTMRFHVRDAESADEDLRTALRHARRALGDEAPAGALVFTCNGRGTAMFAAPHHDAAAIAEELSDIPTAGLFCNGEMGPVGGRNFLHGFTATMALFATGPESP